MLVIKQTDLEGCCCNQRQSESDGQVEPQSLSEEPSHDWLLQGHCQMPKGWGTKTGNEQTHIVNWTVTTLEPATLVHA